MAFEVVKSTGYPVIEEGTYPARVVGLIDLGVHDKLDYKTNEPVVKNGVVQKNRKVFITFELPTERIDVEEVSKPRWVSKEYTLSFFEKSVLSQLIKACVGSNEIKVLDELIGKSLLINIGITSGGKNKVTGASPVMKGMEVGALENPSQVFDMDNPDMAVWERLPQFLQDKIKESHSFADSELNHKLHNEAKVKNDKDDFEDDVPF